jgi:cellobiose phosphorylase
VPCVPGEWESFKVHYRYKNTVYHIAITQQNNAGKMIVTVDGVKQEERSIALTDDEQEHNVQIEIYAQRELPTTVEEQSRN